MGKIKRTLSKSSVYLAIFLLMLWTFIPFLWMFISSITPASDLLVEKGAWLPDTPTLERYRSVAFDDMVTYRGAKVMAPGAVFRKSIANSFKITAATTMLCLVFSSLSAYAYARLRFRLKRPMMALALFFQLLPPIVLLVPMYLLVRQFGLIDKPVTLVLIYTSFVLVYDIWILTGYFKSVPFVFDEAARVDGCSRLGALFHVVLPSSVPGLVAVGVLSFMMCWDEFMYALIFTNSMDSKTIPVAISEFTTQFGIDYGMMMTGGVLATVIPMILAMVFQKYIVMGLTAGAVKE